MCLGNLAVEFKDHIESRNQALYAVFMVDNDAGGFSSEVCKAFDEFLLSTHDHAAASVKLTASMVEGTS